MRPFLTPSKLKRPPVLIKIKSEETEGWAFIEGNIPKIKPKSKIDVDISRIFINNCSFVPLVE